MALKPLNSVGGFSVGETPSNVIYPNGYFTGNGALFSGNVVISNATPSWGILVDNLYYSNGLPWDLQEAAGSNTQIQFNLNNNFAASANFTFDPATNLFTVNGNSQFNNANLGNLATANFVNVASNVISNNITVNLELSGNTANFSGNVVLPNLTVNTTLVGNVANFSGNLTAANANLGNLATANFVNVSSNVNVTNTMQAGNVRTDNLLYANGNPWDFQEAAGSNTQIQYNMGDNFAASANLTYDDATQQFTVLGNAQFNNANLGNLATANFINVASNVLTSNLTVNSALSGNNANFSGNVTVNLELAGNTANFSGNVILPNLTVNTNIAGNTANFTGNISAANANLGNLVTANYVNVAFDLNGNIANFTGNLTAANANLGNLVTANYINVANDLNVIGNVNAGNLVGTLANGNSNVRVFQNANIEFSSNGVANIVTITNDAILVAGNIQSTTGNVLANGNVTANGTLNGANANVTGEGRFGSVVTSNITAPTGNITISAVGVDQNIILAPTGNGAVDVSNKKIVQLQDPTNPKDAATKEYVDSTSQGLTIHTAVRVTSLTNLNATYANGGSVLTTIAITGGKTIQFSAAHGLSAGDELAWDNSFNGLIGDDPYFVFSTPAADTITVKAGYFGAEVTTLTNGTGLSQTARANTGVGATLTNAGANAALSIDGITLSATNRVLVQGQTNQFENGVYTVTTVGAPDSPGPGSQWVLTRATDEDTYSPVSTSALGYGDYFFVQQGTSYAGSSYVVTSPVGEILFGLTNIAFSQFSAAGSFSAGNGIAITGTIISANVDNDTTAISSGNIVVKASANLTTPNIGDATFSSLSWNTLSNGNVTANNLSIGNIANITANLTVGGNIQANGTISSNANVSGLNLTTSGNVQATGNVLANNVNANSLLTVPTANVSNIVNAGNVAITNVLTGNTANFSGNVILPNLTVNLELAGNTANFTGNISAANANLGNLVTANFANIASNVTTSNLTVNLELAGNTANFTGNISAANANLGNLVTANFFTGTLNNGTSNVAIPTTNGNVNITAGGNTSLVVTATGANVVGNLNISSTLLSNNANISNAIVLGNTAVYWGTTTTSTVGANQTIATIPTSGISGYEFIVKGIDSTGSKYSVATVTAVTDGTTVDYVTFATATLGGATGVLAVNVVGANISLQVTPASSNSTVWTTQFRTI